jgi:hypothetical protein
MDERFLPLDGGPAPINDDLAISDGACTGPYEVCLKNGRMLLPQSMFERMKAIIQARKKLTGRAGSVLPVKQASNQIHRRTQRHQMEAPYLR